MSRGAPRQNFVGDRRPCNGCGREIVVTEVMARHRKYSCGSCESARACDWARRNRDKKREANNRYASAHSADRARRTAAWRANHPEKRVAHQAVQTALRNGSLTKAPCEVCGTEARVHAHHDDYAKPLDVIWLCHTHHMKRHAMLAARSQP